MTVVVRAPATGSGGSGSLAPARNYRGAVTGLAPQAADTLATAPATAWKLRGFAVTGDNDFFAWVELDGVPIEGLSARRNVATVVRFTLPNPEAFFGISVVLKVRNEANLLTGVSGSFEGVLFGE
jgi:hypothetical protein